MGMFDYYKPKEQVTCPVCDIELIEWQGKEGPCGLFVWEQGCEFPVGQRAGQESNLPERNMKEFHLPEQFEIYSYDCPNHQPIVATCISKSGVWVITKVME